MRERWCRYCVCVCVCVCVCMCVYVCMCMCVCVCICVHILQITLISTHLIHHSFMHITSGVVPISKPNARALYIPPNVLLPGETYAFRVTVRVATDSSLSNTAVVVLHVQRSALTAVISGVCVCVCVCLCARVCVHVCIRMCVLCIF